MDDKQHSDVSYRFKPGDRVIRRIFKPSMSLRVARRPRFVRFLRDIIAQTPLLKMIYLLGILWLLFSAGVYFAERGVDGTAITSYGRALYWGIAAFSTAGIADTPLSGSAQVVGGIWIVVGSIIFFGTIVAVITTYFLRPLKHPVRQIVDTIQYNLEQLEDLSPEEIDLLKSTTNALYDYVEHINIKQAESTDEGGKEGREKPK